MATAAETQGASIPRTMEAKDQEANMSSSPVELNEMQTSIAAEIMQETEKKEDGENEEDTTASAEQQTQQAPPSTTIEQEDTTTSTQPPTVSTDEKATTKPTPHRKPSEALGPATDLPITAPITTPHTGPTLSITLMLTTGARHPYKIDEKYLKNRKVESSTTSTGAGRSGSSGAGASFDPREISGYKLKELIWTDWRSEWEPRPASPSSIRLIILGRLVEDQRSLKEFPFKLEETNVVHMTVKPADFLDDDDAGGGKKGHSIRGNDGEERDAGCCRCVIL